jgi:hypothetical protein
LYAITNRAVTEAFDPYRIAVDFRAAINVRGVRLEPNNCWAKSRKLVV